MSVSTSPRTLRGYWVAMKVAERFSSRLAGVIADRIWFTPWPVPIGERGRAKQAGWLEQTETVEFKTAHGRVHGFAAGEGPAVLLVHGWGDVGASMGAFIAPLVADGYRVVGIDLPGHGRSESMRPNAFMFAEVIAEVAEKVGGLHAVVAHSMGGLATTLALRAGLAVDRVALISPTSDLESVFESYSTMLRLSPRARKGLGDQLERRFGPRVWQEMSPLGLSSNLRTPAIVIHDRDDTQVAFRDSVRLTAFWSSAELITTEGLGHGKILRDPSVIEKVTTFLSGIPQRDGARTDRAEEVGV